MSNSYNAGTASKIQAMLSTIGQMLGMTMTLPNSAGFSLKLSSPEGQTMNAELAPVDQGVSAHLFSVDNSAMDTGLDTYQATTSATGTLSSGALDINLANLTTDVLAVKLVTSHGTAGVLSVKRKSASQVTVQSWLSGTGIQSSDISDIKVYNLGS